MSVDPTWAPPPVAGSTVCYRHPDREAGIRCVRCDRPICSACMVSAPVGFQCPECVREGARTVRRPTTRFGGRAVQAGPVTWTLVAINVAVFLLTAYTGHRLVIYGSNASPLYRDFALSPPYIAHGQWYRLVTSAFLHYGILHIATNMYALIVIGPSVENALGRWRYVVLYLLSGIGGGLLTMLLASPDSQSAGASGAIFGLFGALFVVLRRMQVSVQPVVAIIVFNLVLSFTIPDISWQGHIGGLITGTAIAAAFVATARRPPGRVQRHIAVTAVVAVLLSGIGVAAVHVVTHKCLDDYQYSEFSGVCTQVMPVPPNDARGAQTVIGVVPSGESRHPVSAGRGGPYA